MRPWLQPLEVMTAVWLQGEKERERVLCSNQNLKNKHASEPGGLYLKDWQMSAGRKGERATDEGKKIINLIRISFKETRWAKKQTVRKKRSAIISFLITKQEIASTSYSTGWSEGVHRKKKIWSSVHIPAPPKGWKKHFQKFRKMCQFLLAKSWSLISQQFFKGIFHLNM